MVVFKIILIIGMLTSLVMCRPQDESELPNQAVQISENNTAHGSFFTTILHLIFGLFTGVQSVCSVIDSPVVGGVVKMVGKQLLDED